MNRQHLAAILWLRFRLTVHQVRRAGVASAVLLAILAVTVAAASIGLFFLGLVGGIAALPRMPPEGVMLLWDVVAACFSFFWLTGLVTELQRSEVLSLEKLLHLPISPTGAFVVNYLGSLAGLTMAAFLPGMIGLGIAQVVTQGAAALLVFPLLAGFLFVVTAVSYQFQGWLASLMVNKRRRRTIIAIVSISFVVLSQVPNLLNSRFWGRRMRADSSSVRHHDELARLDRALDAGALTGPEHRRLSESERTRYADEQRNVSLQRKERTFLIARRINLAVPLGWFPYGAMGCARGDALPALLGILGLGLVGAASLRRSYRTTLRLYAGHFTGERRRPRMPVPVKAVAPGAGLLERDIPGISERTAAVALAGYRSLTRAPEAKMALLTPVILVLLYGSMTMAGRARPLAVRPFLALGAIGVVLLSLQQIVGNQFGLDRDGFRALVLSPSPRRDILLGKNLSLAPVGLGLGLILIALVQVAFPMRLDHLAATLAELGSTYLLFCLVANLGSILAPVPLASGSLRPAHPRAGVLLVRFALALALPILLALAALPLGLELLLHHLGWLPSVPLYLICSLPELGVIAWLYRLAIDWQGRLLQTREQRILEVVTTKVE